MKKKMEKYFRLVLRIVAFAFSVAGLVLIVVDTSDIKEVINVIAIALVINTFISVEEFCKKC